MIKLPLGKNDEVNFSISFTLPQRFHFSTIGYDVTFSRYREISEYDVEWLVNIPL